MHDNILVVDDEPYVLSSLKRLMMSESYGVYTAESGPEALELMKAHAIKVVISDERMPEMPGSEFLGIVRQQYPNTIRITLTGHASIDAAMNAVNKGEIYRFFTKPWNDVDLKFAVRSALDKYNLEDLNRRLLETVRSQAVEIKLLEKQYPGITDLERDDAGKLVVPDLSADDYDAIIRECNIDIG